MVLNGRNGEITDILRLNNGVTVSGFFLGGSYTSHCDWCSQASCRRDSACVEAKDFRTEKIESCWCGPLSSSLST